MTYNDRGEPICESCGKTYDGTIHQAQVRGWGHWKGQTGGGSEREHIICRDCRIITHKRPARQEQAFEDEPLF